MMSNRQMLGQVKDSKVKVANSGGRRYSLKLPMEAGLDHFGTNLAIVLGRYSVSGRLILNLTARSNVGSKLKVAKAGHGG